jgi:2-polyprenyl-3-methyl-5-hydroxy-6-metoxy-1,4-benzoquinol methylase
LPYFLFLNYLCFAKIIAKKAVSMAQEDKKRWDEKHAQDTMPHEPIELVKEYAKLAKGTKALDIACGNGRHSKYLSKLGFEVDALDISSVAIKQLQNIPNINAIEVDFDTYKLKKNRYDLIVCTYFLERKLFPQMITALKQDGIILMETFVNHKDNGRKPTHPHFRLEVGELEEYFKKYCEVISYQEWWERDYQGYNTLKASLVAKKKF